MTEGNSMGEERLELATGFGPFDRADWLREVERALKGADFDKALVSRTHDGIAIEPLYHPSTHPAPDPGRPGAPPFIRGHEPATTPASRLDVRPLRAEPDPAEANARILDDLAGGAGSILLRLDDALAAGGETPDGVVIKDAAALERALAGVDLQLITLQLDAGTRHDAMVTMLDGLVAARGLDPTGLAIAFGMDPAGLIASGRASPSDAMAHAADIALDLARRYPASRPLQVNGELYHAAGASEATELAAAIATGILYLRALEGAGLAPDEAASRIGFTLAADADIFLTIAKFRAARRLWSHVLDRCGVGAEAAAGGMTLHAMGASRMMTARDPHVNWLRGTSACLAAIAGGADAITILPFDHVLGLPGETARRIARNTGIILDEESHLARVIDPAGGSLYVENLTGALAEAAWGKVREIERAGGMVRALEEGIVQDAIGTTFMARMADIAFRRSPVTGVSTFPDLAEKPAGPAIVRGAPTGEIPVVSCDGAIPSPLRPMRLAEGFERLRDISDERLAATGSRPRIMLAGIGSLASASARLTFARNAFEAGGIEAIEAVPLEGPDETAAAFRESGCRIACICAAKPVLGASAGAHAAALRAAGAEAIFLAGRPEEADDPSAIDRAIFEGCNILGLLEDVHSLLLEARA